MSEKKTADSNDKKKYKDHLVPELSGYSDLEWKEILAQSSAVSLYRQWCSTDMAQEDHHPGDHLRRERHLAWVRAALATYFQRSSTEDICLYWSFAADQIIEKAWRESGLDQFPLLLLALGKLGAQELNLSSDVDLMVISETGANAEMDRGIKKFRHLLASVTAFGFSFRLDFDLRPGGRFAPLISSLAQVENYYWSQGETWERLALVRARALQGPFSLIENTLSLFNKFCFRKYIDYTLLEDLKQLRQRVHQFHLSQSQQKDFSHKQEFDLKLGVGGIRDIELFVHALQVIHGGRDKNLQTYSTSQALYRLQERNILPEKEAKQLHFNYWRFRHAEHLAQLVSDQQTHSYIFNRSPQGQPHPLQVSEIEQKASEVDQLVSTLLGGVEYQLDELPPTLELQEKWLMDLGFSEMAIRSHWQELINQTARSSKRERDEIARKKFLFDFVMEVSRIGVDKDLALSILLSFTQAIRAKATLFSLFAYEPRLMRDLARLFSVSPYLGTILASRPELIDSFIFRSQDKFSSDLETCLEEMAEYRLLNEIIVANQFLSDRDSRHLGERLSHCADDICENLLNRIDDRAENQRLKVLALGKWGGRELGLRSDLDLVFISLHSPEQKDHTVAKRFIHRLNDLHKGGRIYSIDLRLRPSGRSGPLIVSWDRLISFLQKEAAPWERQAYLRARIVTFINQNSDLPSSLSSTSLTSCISHRGLSLTDIAELKKIRERLLLPSLDNSLFTDLKLSPGGMLDIELAIQSRLLYERLTPQGPSTLEMIKTLAEQRRKSFSLTKLIKIYSDLRMVEQMAQLTFNHRGSQISRQGSDCIRLAQVLKESPSEMHERLTHLMKQSSEIIKQIDPIHFLSATN